MAVRVNLARGTIERQYLDANCNDLSRLQGSEDALHNAVFGPAIKSLVYGRPWAILSRQGAPFAPVFSHIQYGIDKVTIGGLYVSALNRKVTSYPFELRLCNIHSQLIPKIPNSVNTT